MATKLDRKIDKLTQEAYKKRFSELYEQEWSKVCTEEDAIKFKLRWTKISDMLMDGWILNPDELDKSL